MPLGMGGTIRIQTQTLQSLTPDYPKLTMRKPCGFRHRAMTCEVSMRKPVVAVDPGGVGPLGVVDAIMAP